jgi:hypothetical protein
MSSFWLSTTGKVAKIAFVFFFASAFARVHLRVQTTMVGYEIGRLKTKEGRLLEDRSELKMELARLTTKQALSLMAEGNDPVQIPSGTFAAQ